MTYRFAVDRTDYSDFSSGHVLHSAPGRTGFPARLATEVFQRAAARLTAAGVAAPWVVYDPCCGAGQLLTTVGLLHSAAIRTLIGSDIDDEAVALAHRNLALVSAAGLERRIAALETLRAEHGRASHAAAIASARRLLHLINGTTTTPDLIIDVFPADITRPGALAGCISGGSVDLVITDVPYGNWSAWSPVPTDGNGNMTPLDRMLDTLRPVLAPRAVVAIVSGKDQRASHPQFRRIERWQLGRRRIELVGLQPGPDGA